MSDAGHVPEWMSRLADANQRIAELEAALAELEAERDALKAQRCEGCSKFARQHDNMPADWCHDIGYVTFPGFACNRWTPREADHEAD